MDKLKELNQSHLQLPDNIQHPLYKQVEQLELSYPGGLQQYCKNAKKLLENSDKNPYEGYSLKVPVGKTIDFNNQEQIDKLEDIGIEELKNSCFVLVAGGLGERLGYKGVKVRIPFELITETTYLQYYIEYIKTLQSKGNTEIPLTIMVSDDTHDLTIQYLQDNNNFGMKLDQIKILKQQKVPSIINKNADLSQQSDQMIETKPHGHGDVHLLLNQSGLVDQWQKQGKKWVIFFQDTNAAVFRSLPSVLGVSKSCNFEMNSITIPRKPGEAVGAICQLEKDDHKMTLNVEYNQIQSLFSGAEPVNEDGFSLYPGNINCLVFSIDEYNITLKQSKGLIAEFINPKYDGKTDNFKSPARLECMMQDYPKLLKNCDKVGFTQIPRLFCFSPCKNNLETSEQKKQQGLSQESAESAENDFYKLNQEILKICGVKFEGQSYVVLKPSFGLTMKEIRQNIKGNNMIMQNSALVLHDGIENLKLDGSIIVQNKIQNLTVENKEYPVKQKVENTDQDYLQIRGYKLQLPKFDKK